MNFESVVKIKKEHRNEIDGLRAAAVLAVMLFHFNPVLLPGGFLGVDVFFVISGFVVCKSLMNLPFSTTSAFLLDFFVRRFKRILPVLFVVVCFTSLITGLFFYEPKLTLTTGLMSLIASGNIFLYEISHNYFNPDAGINVFQHMWSLGVEEQFYFLFPFLVLLGLLWAKRSNRDRFTTIFYIVGSMSILSFLIFNLYARENPMGVFFLMPYRFWELGVGIIGYLASIRFERLKFHEGILTLISSASFLTILICFLFPETYSRISIPAVVATTGLLLFCESWRSALSKVLSLKPLVFIGLISYSLYLWHWPVYIVTKQIEGLFIPTIWIQFISTFVLALGSYYFIENPCRFSVTTDYRVVFKRVFLGLLTSAFFIISIRAFSQRLYLGTKPFNFSVSQFLPNFQLQHCRHQMDFELEIFPPICFFSKSQDRDLPTIWFIGDSTAWSLKSTAGELAQNHNYNIAMFADDMAFPIKNLRRINYPDPDEKRWNDDQTFTQKASNYLNRYVKPGDTVIISFAANSEFCTEYNSEVCPELKKNIENMVWENSSGKQITRLQALDLFLQEMSEQSFDLASKDVGMILIAPLPRWTKMHKSYCDRQGFKSNPYMERCYSPGFDDQVQMRNFVFTKMKQKMATSRFVVYDPFPIFCSSEYCKYANEETNENYFLDETHLSTLGGKLLVDSLLETIHEIHK